MRYPQFFFGSSYLFGSPFRNIILTSQSVDGLLSFVYLLNVSSLSSSRRAFSNISYTLLSVNELEQTFSGYAVDN